MGTTIVLADTHVISEFVKKAPDAQVIPSPPPLRSAAAHCVGNSRPKA